MNGRTATLNLSLAAMLLVVVAHSASADHIDCCGNKYRWASSNLDLGWCTSSFSASSHWVARMEEAAQEWTDLPESDVDISLSSDSHCSSTNNDSEIWYTNSSSGDGSLIIATTTFINSSCSNFPCCMGCTAPELTVTDIVIYAQNSSGSIPWSVVVPTGAGSQPNSGFTYFLPNFQHELGHAMGLLHTSSGMTRMATFDPGGGWFYSGADTVQPLGHDRWDANAVYPEGSFTNYSNIYMINIQSDGNVSRPLSSSGSVANYYPRNTNPISGQDFNAVRVGDTVQMRVCRGNVGPKKSPSYDIDVYLSQGDRWWSASDVYAGTFQNQSGLSGYTKGCFTGTFTVPSGVSAGKTYYVLFGNGTSGNDIAVQDRPIKVIP